jgi:GT2 family glycosyltransferase
VDTTAIGGGGVCSVTGSVWAVVLNYRDAAGTLDCLATLRRVRYRSLTAVVVDNDSGSDEVATLRNAGATVIESGANLGFAGGNNFGIRAAIEAGADAVWILNPDCRPHPRSLRRLMRVLRRHPEVGILGVRILEAGGRPRKVQSEGGRIVWEAGGRSELINRGKTAGRGGGLHTVDFVPGGAMLVRRAVFEGVGLLPEEYFMYFEETEFCVRAAAAGWRVAVETGASMTHPFSSSDGLPSEALAYYFVRSRLLFGLRHTKVPFDDLVADLQRFIESWRRRVKELRPEWLGRYEELVSQGVADARAGLVGRRPDVG